MFGWSFALAHLVSPLTQIEFQLLSPSCSKDLTNRLAKSSCSSHVMHLTTLSSALSSALPVTSLTWLLTQNNFAIRQAAAVVQVCTIVNAASAVTNVQLALFILWPFGQGTNSLAPQRFLLDLLYAYTICFMLYFMLQPMLWSSWQ